MNWQRIKPDPEKLKDKLIIIAARQDERHWYNVVFYHEPLKIWYGGPGIRVKTDDIEWWSEIPAPAEASA